MYISEAEVTNTILTTVVKNKIKQWDQSNGHNSHVGSPDYVRMDGMYGNRVEAIRFSRTTPWLGDENEQFSELRFAINGESGTGPKVKSFSFEYRVIGSVEKNDRYTFKDLDGNSFSSDAYVQIKTAEDHPLAGDNYPELSGTDFIIDGDWHSTSYTFDEPLNLLDILINLYHFQGEIYITNLVIEYES